MEPALIQNPAFIWFVTGIILILAEFVLPGLVVIFFGVGALSVSIMLVAVHVGLFWQLLMFTVISVALLVFLRKKIQNRDSSREERAEEIIGEKTMVKEMIPVGGYGKVFFKGALWKAETDDTVAIPEGVWVEIISYNSIVLKVKK